METPKEYYYTYYSYEEWGRGYIGSRGCCCLPENDIHYFGTFADKTFKPTQKIILKSDYATREEAYADEIILQQYYKVIKNPHFANRAYQTSTKFCVSKEQAIQNGKKSKQLGLGFHSFTPEQKSKNSKKGGKNAQEILQKNNKGFYGIPLNQRQENSRKGGTKAKELGLGIHALTPEQKGENGKKMSLDDRRKNANIMNSQIWMCLETGFTSTPAGLSQYQKKRGIDVSKRERIL